MGSFFDDTMQGLLQAVDIEKGNTPLVEKADMPAPTYIVCDREQQLIEQMISIRKEQHITQKQLAEITGNKQQAISRIERSENSPSLQIFCNILSALGYGLVIEKK